MHKIVTEPLDTATFAPFGDVLGAAGPPDWLINAGRAARFHDRARLDFAADRSRRRLAHRGHAMRAAVSV